MVIKLNNDFSDNNIGTIEIPFELNAETVALLAKCTRYTESSPQTLAVDSFITTLKDEGIFNKIALLNLPFMGKTVTEIAYDVISDAYLTWNNVGTYDATNETMAAVSNYSTNVNIPQFKTVDNFHAHFIMQGGHPDLWGSSKNIIACGRATRSSKSPAVFINSFNTNKNYYDADVVNGAYGGLFNLISDSLNTDGSKFYTVVSNAVQSYLLTKSDTYDVEAPSNYSLATCMFIGSRTTSPVSVKKEVHIIGNAALTDTQATALMAAIKTLRDALL